MREILFRGFHPTEDAREKVFINNEPIKGRWVYGCFCEPCNITYSKWGYDKVLKREDTIYYDDVVIPETVGQYTGLTDKNGNKIFEGDILEFGEYKYTVEWKADRLGYGYAESADRMLECDSGHCEVIGNAYSNPGFERGAAK